MWKTLSLDRKIRMTLAFLMWGLIAWQGWTIDPALGFAVAGSGIALAIWVNRP